MMRDRRRQDVPDALSLWRREWLRLGCPFWLPPPPPGCDAATWISDRVRKEIARVDWWCRLTCVALSVGVVVMAVLWVMGLR